MIKNILIILAVIITIATLAGSSWRVRDFVFSTVTGLPVAENDITIDRNSHMATPDGVRLAAHLYRPKREGSYPTIIMRTPYGRDGVVPAVFAEFLARRGFIVLSQDERGTGGSGGAFSALEDTKRDGAAAINWVKEQPWFNGEIATFGLSYLGHTSTAMAVQNDPAVKAAFSAIGIRSFKMLYRTGAFDLDSALGWSMVMHEYFDANFENAGEFSILAIMLMPFRKPSEPLPFNHLPVAEADTAAAGAPLAYFQSFVNNADTNSPYWVKAGISEQELAESTTPLFLSSAWHDIALPDVVSDYEILKAAGKNPRLSIGSGPHGDFPAIIRYMRDSKAWFDHILKDKPLTITEKRVRINVLRTDDWIRTDSWPIPTKNKRFYLEADAMLSETAPTNESAPTVYDYDPNDPTPVVGGMAYSITTPVVDNAAFEARDDTIVFTADPFTDDTLVAGEILASIYIESNVETSDLLVRVNRVSKSGKSENITDDLRRVFFEKAEGGLKRVEFPLLPTAVQFKKGERLRVLVTSGAHPRFSRNLGSGTTQEQAFARQGKPAKIKIHHSSTTPSYIELPIAFDVETSRGSK